jgi:nicotinate-nucleotide adenylyltransferase
VSHLTSFNKGAYTLEQARSQSHHAQRIGLIGGTFDPIHNGHLIIAEEVRAALDLEMMIFIPAGQPPHKTEYSITPAYHRMAMVQLAIASNNFFVASRVEIDRSGPSYLVDTLRILHEQLPPEAELVFVLGWDSLLELRNWYDPAGILEQLAYLVAVGRPGYGDKIAYNSDDDKELEAQLPGLTQRLRIVPTPQIGISSTDLRSRVARGRPIKYQVPEAVEQYINTHGLYR